MDNNEIGRKIFSRWVVTGKIKLISVVCIGGNEDGLTDISILKDTRNGFPMISGSTLAGAMRSLMKNICPNDYCKLFGADKNDSEGDQSSLIVYDSICESEKDFKIEHRDGVKIDSDKGISDRKHKYDYEVITQGSFPVRFELIISYGEQEKELIILLIKMLDLLFNEKMSLGHKKNRGLGLMKLTRCKIKRFNMFDKKSCLDWLCSDYNNPIPEQESDITSKSDIFKLNVIKELEIKPKDIQYSEFDKFEFSANFTIPYGMLIKSCAKEINDSDVVYLTSYGSPIVSGTSLAGVLRHQALRIANTVRKINNNNDSQDWVDYLFGKQEGRKTIASLVKVSENNINNKGIEKYVKRIQIDRFTQGVMSHALFDEKYIPSGEFGVKISLINNKRFNCNNCMYDHIKGFFMLIIKDLVDGLITIGGSSSIGRGRIEVVKDSLKLLNGSKEMKLWDNTENEDTQLADKWIKAFIDAKELNS